MTDLLRSGACALLLLAAWGVHAQQVYRCGGTDTYTDKPCDNAEPVDVRPNLMDAGPTVSTSREAPDQPAGPTVLKNIGRVVTPAAGSRPSIWESKDSRDAGHNSRTAPYTPAR
jgi:hypothetical protein